MENLDVLKSGICYIRDCGKWNTITQVDNYYNYFITIIALLHGPGKALEIYQKFTRSKLHLLMPHIFEKSEFVVGYSTYDWNYIKVFIRNTEKHNDDTQRYVAILETWGDYYPIKLSEATEVEWNYFVLKHFYSIIVKKGLDIMKNCQYFVEKYGHAEQSQFFVGLMFFSNEDVTF